ncbi:MAG: energy transducer TonB [Pseudomonadota bacterium]
MSARFSFWAIAIVISLLIHASILLNIKPVNVSGALDLGAGGIKASLVELKKSVKGSKSENTDTPKTEKPVQKKLTKPPPTPKPQPVKKTVTKSEVKPKKINKPAIAVKEKILEKKPELVKPAIEPLEQATNTPAETQVTDTSKQIIEDKVALAEPAKSGSNVTGGASNKTSAGGAAKKAKSDYAALLKSILDKSKRYPERARKRRQEGTVYLFFKVDSSGALLEYRIKESSGYKILDKEVEKLIVRVTPFPEFPDDISSPHMDITIPISYTIK